MKNVFSFILGLITLSAFSQSYSYKFTVDGVANDTVYLANYFGGKLYYNDTTAVDANGKFAFEGEGTKKGGIYAVILPDGQTYFELVINEPSFSAKTKAVNPEGNITFKGSAENEAFYKYKNYLINKRKEGTLLQQKLKAAEGKERSAIDKQIKALNQEVIDFRNNFFDNNEGLLIAKIMRMTLEPEVSQEMAKSDSTAAFRFFKSNYLKHVDFSDDRMLYTPIFNGKVDYYLQKLTPQVPDSICAAATYMAGMADEDSEIFKYVVQYTTSTYEKSKIMGMDAVFVCMAENFYLKDKAYWMDSAKIAEIEERYGVLKNLTLGQVADNITLLNEKDEWKALHDIDSEFTVLYFWDPNCGHCKKETPKLQTFYEEWKDKGVEVYAVCTEFEMGDWKKYIKENGLTFINVSDNPEINQNAWKYINSGKTTLTSLNFRDYWDIFSTPQFYLLDKDKKIIAKKLGTEQLGDFIEKKRAQK